MRRENATVCSPRVVTLSASTFGKTLQHYCSASPAPFTNTILCNQQRIVFVTIFVSHAQHSVSTHGRRHTSRPTQLCSSAHILPHCQHPRIHKHRHASPYNSTPLHTAASISKHQHTSSYISTHLHTSTRISIHQHAFSYISTHLHTSARLSIHQHASPYTSTPLHTPARLSIHQHTPPYISTHLHTSTRISIYQHASPYISTRLYPSDRNSKHHIIFWHQHASPYIRISRMIAKADGENASTTGHFHCRARVQPKKRSPRTEHPSAGTASRRNSAALVGGSAASRFHGDGDLAP